MNEDDALLHASIDGSKATAGGKIVLFGRVSARLGELLPMTPKRLAAANPNAKRKPRKKRKPIFGSVVGILGAKKYKVHFDDGTETEWCSNRLKYHRQGASLPPEDALQIAEGGVDAGETCRASLKQLEAISASAAADATGALDEDKHLPRDDEIIQDLLGLVDDDGGLVSSEDESSDDESILQRPMATSRNAEQLLSPVHPVDFGINPYNDDVDVEDDGMLAHGGVLAQIKIMPSLDAGVLLCADSSDDAAPNGVGAGAAAPGVAPRLPSGQMQQRQDQDCDMAVANLSYKQRFETDRARITSKIGHKVTVKQGSGRQEK
jgi:hypothetical protein